MFASCNNNYSTCLCLTRKTNYGVMTRIEKSINRAASHVATIELNTIVVTSQSNDIMIGTYCKYGTF